MMKKLLTLVWLPLVLAGCTTTLPGTFTNLTPAQQPRNANNAYSVEVAFNSRQQTLRWETIQPYVVVDTDFYPMRRTALMKNRWEALIPVPAGESLVHYSYKFDYECNALGKPRDDSVRSPVYTLQIKP